MATDSTGTSSDYGKTIRRRRQIMRLTQAQLAKRLGVDRSAVSAWERGLHFPERYQGALEAELGISLDGTPSPRRQIPAHTKRVLRAALPDDDDYERVIALLEHGEGDANGDRGARAG